VQGKALGKISDFQRSQILHPHDAIREEMMIKKYFF